MKERFLVDPFSWWWLHHHIDFVIEQEGRGNRVFRPELLDFKWDFYIWRRPPFSQWSSPTACKIPDFLPLHSRADVRRESKKTKRTCHSQFAYNSWHVRIIISLLISRSFFMLKHLTDNFSPMYCWVENMKSHQTVNRYCRYDIVTDIKSNGQSSLLKTQRSSEIILNEDDHEYDSSLHLSENH